MKYVRTLLSLGIFLSVFFAPVWYVRAEIEAVTEKDAAQVAYRTELQRTIFWRAVKAQSGNVPADEKALYNEVMRYVQEAHRHPDPSLIPSRYNHSYLMYTQGSEARVQNPYLYFFSNPEGADSSFRSGFSDRFMRDAKLFAYPGDSRSSADQWPLPMPVLKQVVDRTTAGRQAAALPFFGGIFCLLTMLILYIIASPIDRRITRLQRGIDECLEQKRKVKASETRLIAQLDQSIGNARRAIQSLEQAKRMKKESRVAFAKQLRDEHVMAAATALNEEALAVSSVVDAHAELGIKEVELRA